MAKKKRSLKTDACREATCPVFPGKGESGASGIPSGCECGRSAELEAVLASTLDPVITIDSFGTVRSASKSIERVFGWKPGELVGRNVHVLMPEPHRSGHNQYLANYRKTLKTKILGRTREFEAVRKDGTGFPVELSVSRADVPGQSLPLFVGIIKDVSERKAAERELQRHRRQLDAMVRERTRALEQSHEQLRMAERLAAIGTLAAGLGHDMNNVLLPMRTRMNALDAMVLPKAATEHLVQMRKSCAYLQQLTDGLHMLALSPDEDDATDAATDLHEWWSTVGPLLTKAVPKGVRFESTVARGLPRVPVAPHKLTQAVLNLIVNAGEAIQSMRKRPHRAVVRLWAHAPGGKAAVKAGSREVHLGVADNGPGMTPEVRAHAFDAFYTTKKRGLGTGLGLSLVRSVVVNAGGEIDIETSSGKGGKRGAGGTEIVLTFPSVHEREGSDSARAATVHLHDRRAASMAAHILEAAGWHVTRAADPSPPLPAAPGGSTIWVTEPSEHAIKAAKEYAKGARSAIVAVGTPSPLAPWARLGAIVVETPRDFDT
ncbi:MAG: PAS domain S-box protein, partial [Phycisphaerales bacterium]|nr:PAS domain S-box protein [Phycisphaerales bacterium]